MTSKNRRRVPLIGRLSARSAALAALLTAVSGMGGAAAAAPQDGDAGDLSKLENPLPYNEETIKAGKALFLYHCQTCHGRDGKAQDNADFQAADLTAPDTWRHGTSDGAIFDSTKNGAGLDMPPFKRQFEDQEIWQLVFFIRSIGPEELRPKMASE